MEARRVVLHGGPWDGREIVIDRGQTEIKIVERPPTPLIAEHIPPAELKLRHGVYRLRSTEPEYQHVFDFIGMQDV